MYSKVMIPVDGSPFAEQALPLAAALLRSHGSRPVLVMAHEVRPFGREFVNYASEQLNRELRQAQKEYLGRLAQRVADEWGMQADTMLLTGPVVPTLARFAARPGIDLIVMSTHGRGGLSRAWLGSVADSLVRRARVPTLLVRPQEGAQAPAQIERVLVAVDGSAAAESAARTAATLCAATGASCTIVRVVIPITHIISPYILDTAHVAQEKLDRASVDAETYLRELVRRIPELPDGTRTEVVTGGQPAASILKCAADDRVDLIVVGTRGHGHATRLLLGSVTDKVLRGAQVPVLVCPPMPRTGGWRERLAARAQQREMAGAAG